LESNFIIDYVCLEGEDRIMKVEMTKVKFLGLIIFAGILMWYFCPWFIRLVGRDGPSELTPPPPVLKPVDIDES